MRKELGGEEAHLELGLRVGLGRLDRTEYF